MPVYPLNFELIANQILGVADDHAICFRIEIDDITRTQRTAGQSFALADREELDAIVLADEISIDIVNLAAMKCRVAQMRAQERFVIVAGNKTNLLAVDLVGDLQA